MRTAAILNQLIVSLALTVALWVAPALAQEAAAPPEAPATQPASAPAADFTPAPAASAAPTLTIAPATNPRDVVLGSNDSTSDYKMRVNLSHYGASVWRITLTDYKWHATTPEPYAVLKTLEVPVAGGVARYYHFGARYVNVDDAADWLWNKPWSLKDGATDGSATYELTVNDAQGQPLLRLERTYTLDKVSYNLRCQQRIENISGVARTVIWSQYAQGDAPADESAYIGDMRRYVAGYFNLEYNPKKQIIYTKNADVPRGTVLLQNENPALDMPRWPEKDLPAHDLVWLATTNRYFALAVHPIVGTPDVNGLIQPHPVPAESLQSIFPHIEVQRWGNPADAAHQAAAITLTTAQFTLSAGQSRAIGIELFAGPQDRNLFKHTPYSLLYFKEMVVYSLGGMCGPCTFQWLAKGLLWLLWAIDLIVRDWGIAIIILVLVVRAILHPITRKAQINMAKMQKGMAALAPEIEKLKKKYKDDSAKLQAEQMRLYRERGVNPLNMLGCLPMFLQMPIWIALYAMLYFAIELRHEPAFYGVFQWISGGKWGFLADLASADHFIRVFDTPKQINLWLIHPNFEAVNILPFLMAIVFYFQQKLMTPPPADPNSQAAQTQKMMKWMVLLFPVMLYSAPSGLTLYIMASTAAGIVDSLLIRRHIKREEEAGTLFKPKPAKPGKPGGLMERIHKMIEEKQQQTGKPKPKGGDKR
ncbi:MAG: YidC/Oxa1 family insertase periplasmic-domain containing protein [Phycisphaeraceae bacterium]